MNKKMTVCFLLSFSFVSGSLVQKNISNESNPYYSRENQKKLVQNSKAELSSSYYSAMSNQSMSENTMTSFCSNYVFLRANDSSTTKVSDADLKENSIEPQQSFSGLSIDHTYNSDGWRGTNKIGRYMAITINSISKVTGVYSHYLDYFDHDLLESGAASEKLNNSSKCVDTVGKTVSFSYSVEYQVESKIGFLVEADGISESASVSEKLGAKFSYDCTYTRNSTKEYNWSQSFCLDSTAATYCPQGYSMSIGRKGIFQVITGSYQEMSVWWWGHYPTQGSSRKHFVSVLVDSDTLSSCFVYKKNNDPSKDYSRR
jgi:hypothetical protein